MTEDRLFAHEMRTLWLARISKAYIIQDLPLKINLSIRSSTARVHLASVTRQIHHLRGGGNISPIRVMEDQGLLIRPRGKPSPSQAQESRQPALNKKQLILSTMADKANQNAQRLSRQLLNPLLVRKNPQMNILYFLSGRPSFFIRMYIFFGK